MNTSGLKITLLTACLLSCFICYSQAGAQQKFWDAVKYNREYRVMDDGLKSWLLSVAKNVSNNSYTKALEILENLNTNKQFQDALCLEAYTNYHGSIETLRYVLGKLCGSYTIGNAMADDVFMKYKNDKRAIAIINERKENERRKEEQQRVKELRSENTSQPPQEKVLPEFKGSWGKFFSDNVVYPKEAQNANVGGKIGVRFIVTKNGEVKDCSVIRRLRYGLDEEAIRVVELTTGKWQPGTLDGVPVDMEYTLSMTFRLN